MNVDPRLLKLAELMGVKVYIENECNTKKGVKSMGLYYWPKDIIVLYLDQINGVGSNLFKRSINEVLAHEIIHSTGNKKRLSRPVINDEPTKHLPEPIRNRMSKIEECVAEVGSVLLGEFFGYQWKEGAKRTLNYKIDPVHKLRHSEWVKEASETAVRYLNNKGFIEQCLS